MADLDWSAPADTDHVEPGDLLLLVRGGVPYNLPGGRLVSLDASGKVTIGAATNAKALVNIGAYGSIDYDSAAVSTVFGQNFYIAGGAYYSRVAGYAFGMRLGNDTASIFGNTVGADASFVPATMLRFDVAGNMRPGADNAQLLGSASYRWSTVYAASGTINTSDEREKRWRGALTKRELAAARAIAAAIGVFRFEEAVRSKKSAARLHVGVKAQEVVALLATEGLDPMRYAFVCHDAWEGDPAAGIAAGDRYGIRYDELAMFLAAAQEQRLAALEARA